MNTNGGNGPPRIAHSALTIDAEIHNAVMTLTPEERMDRAIVDEAVRTQMTPLRLAGSADEYRVPKATE
jgi:hypothetical protein